MYSSSRSVCTVNVNRQSEMKSGALPYNLCRLPTEAGRRYEEDVGDECKKCLHSVAIVIFSAGGYK